MRRGEALALHWSDLDLEARTLTVRGTLGRVGGELIITEPKTERSRRSVPLSPLGSRVSVLASAASTPRRALPHRSSSHVASNPTSNRSE